MNKTEKVVVALLGAIAIEGAVCTAAMVKLVCNGVEVKVTAEEIEAAREVFEQDFQNE